MITLRSGTERGIANVGWLNSKHTFSFGSYYDPNHMGFASLRVINEDQVEPSRGFDTHGHRDMEIISYVLDGALEHKDNIGNGSVMKPGDVQRMSAGTGILHSEYNHSTSESVHFLQIWILPNERGLEPGYEQKHFTVDDKRNQLRLVGSPNGRDGSVIVHQDVDLYASVIDPGVTLTHHLASNRIAWIQVAQGSVSLNGQRLSAGDGAAVEEISDLSLEGSDTPAEVLLFDLAAS